MTFDVAVIGAGIAGMATALRLQAHGCSTVLLEAHQQPGGCAGYFQRRGFCFDVGATTLVDFSPGGVGGQFLDEVGVPAIKGELLPAYQVWLPDRTVTLYHDEQRWIEERLEKLGSTPGHRRFWQFMDKLGDIYWGAARAGVKLPIQNASDLMLAARCVHWRHWGLSRHLLSTVGNALHQYGLESDLPTRGLLKALLEDTVHAPPGSAPLINGALGISIRRAGLTRADGGMRGFFGVLSQRYEELGGVLRTRANVTQLARSQIGKRTFSIITVKGDFRANQVVSTLPIWNTARLGLPEITKKLDKYLQRDGESLGSAVAVFLGVPEHEILSHELTHHQLLASYEAPLGCGNNMFMSVSAAGDDLSAPAGFRTVMLSTHTRLDLWDGHSRADYEKRKEQIGETLITQARRVYPELGRNAVVREVATPRTYERFTRRHRGAVGGIRMTLQNSNQFAVPQNLGVPGFWQAGDTTWPGLGTVACLLGSRHAASGVLRDARRIQKSLSIPPDVKTMPVLVPPGTLLNAGQDQ